MNDASAAVLDRPITWPVKTVVFDGLEVFEYGDEDDRITHIECPNATSVYLMGFESLEHIHAPLARLVDVETVESLRSLEAPLAVEVRLGGSNHVEALDLPCAEIISIEWYDTLVEVTAPNAYDVTLRHCHNLETFDMSNVRSGHVIACGKLLPQSDDARLSPLPIDNEVRWTA